MVRAVLQGPLLYWQGLAIVNSLELSDCKTKLKFQQHISPKCNKNYIPSVRQTLRTDFQYKFYRHLSLLNTLPQCNWYHHQSQPATPSPESHYISKHTFWWLFGNFMSYSVGPVCFECCIYIFCLSLGLSGLPYTPLSSLRLLYLSFDEVCHDWVLHLLLAQLILCPKQQLEQLCQQGRCLLLVLCTQDSSIELTGNLCVRDDLGLVLRFFLFLG